MPRPIGRLVALGSAMTAALASCSLIDLSGLQGGLGGQGSSSSSATSTSSSTGQGGSSPCGAIACSLHGHCETTAQSTSCVCDGHYQGASCDTCSVGYTGDGCFGCAPGFQDANDDGSCLPSCTSATCSGHGVCSDTSGVATCTCTNGFGGADCSTACQSGMGGPDCAFRIVYGLDIPTTAYWTVPADVPYDVDATTSAPAFTRVAYRFVLDQDEVWVEMDAFTSDPTKLGVPVAWQWAMPVLNAIVISGSSRTMSIATPTAGGLEFWSDCYTEGPDGQFDEHDIPGTQAGCYGSMQVSVGGANVFSFNAWAKNDTIDVGIGRAPSGSPDWTFAGNAAHFMKRRLEVYVKP